MPEAPGEPERVIREYRAEPGGETLGVSLVEYFYLQRMVEPRQP